jgi:hypothetical protein
MAKVQKPSDSVVDCTYDPVATLTDYYSFTHDPVATPTDYYSFEFISASISFLPPYLTYFLISNDINVSGIAPYILIFTLYECLVLVLKFINLLSTISILQTQNLDQQS